MDIKQKITDSINYVVKILGFTLVYEAWGAKSTQCACALGCLILNNEGSIEGEHEENIQTAADLLGTSSAWVESFYHGFDESVPHIVDGPSGPEIAHRDAYQMGQEIREQFNPKQFDEFMDERVG